jgi:catechol 2,3-dioxygenase-like lactoylglutathione lyase family enzyme
MFSHVHVGVTDFTRAWRFYRAVLPLLGLQERFSEPERGWGGWQSPGRDRPLFLIGRPFDGQPANCGNGPMPAFLAADRPTVDKVHQAALAAGGTSEGEPGLRPHYHANYYGAYFRDPDGNKLCVCCHEPA